MKHRLDAIMLSIAKKELGANAKIHPPPGPGQDLRRTAVTGMRKLGTSSDLVKLDRQSRLRSQGGCCRCLRRGRATAGAERGLGEVGPLHCAAGR